MRGSERERTPFSPTPGCRDCPGNGTSLLPVCCFRGSEPWGCWLNAGIEAACQGTSARGLPWESAHWGGTQRPWQRAQSIPLIQQWEGWGTADCFPQSQSHVCHVAALPSLEDLDLALCPLSDVCLLCHRQHGGREVAALGSHCFLRICFKQQSRVQDPRKLRCPCGTGSSV